MAIEVKKMDYKKVLLRKRRRNAACHVSSTPYAVLSRGVPHPSQGVPHLWPGGTPSLIPPILTWLGYLILGTPFQVPPGRELVPVTGVPPGKDMVPVEVFGVPPPNVD